MKLLITGGRDFHDYEFVRTVLDKLNSDIRVTHIIHGNASGADQLAGTWCRQAGLQEVVCPADWKRHGRSAGPMRNKAMLDLIVPWSAPDRVIAFPGNLGTEHMIRIAKQAGVYVEEHAP